MLSQHGGHSEPHQVQGNDLVHQTTCNCLRKHMCQRRGCRNGKAVKLRTSSMVTMGCGRGGVAAAPASCFRSADVRRGGLPAAAPPSSLGRPPACSAAGCRWGCCACAAIAAATIAV
jgi:hypothetical protein